MRKKIWNQSQIRKEKKRNSNHQTTRTKKITKQPTEIMEKTNKQTKIILIMMIMITTQQKMKQIESKLNVCCWRFGFSRCRIAGAVRVKCLVHLLWARPSVTFVTRMLARRRRHRRRLSRRTQWPPPPPPSLLVPWTPTEKSITKK